MTEPKWSTTLPVEPGWYWCRFKGERTWAVPARVVLADDGTHWIERELWHAGVETEWYLVRIEEPPR